MERTITCIFKDGTTKQVNLDWIFQSKQYSAVDFNMKWFYLNKDCPLSHKDLIRYEDIVKNASDFDSNWHEGNVLIMYKKNGRLYWASSYGGYDNLFLTDIYNNKRTFFASQKQLMPVMYSEKALKYLAI